MGTLEDEFNEAMLNIYRSAIEACGYRAKAFLAMVIELRGLNAAKKLLASSDLQSGLYELFECSRLDLTVENLVLQDRYRELFTVEELKEAERRLELLGFGCSAAQ